MSREDSTKPATRSRYAVLQRRGSFGSGWLLPSAGVVLPLVALTAIGGCKKSTQSAGPQAPAQVEAPPPNPANNLLRNADFADGNKDLKDLLGGKGANLAEMTNLGLPVPPGFTITTDACRRYMADGWPPGLDAELERHLARLAATRRDRDAGEVEAALRGLRETAARPESSETNLMPHFIRCAEAYATLGEMCGVLRGVFGEYREPAAV